MAETCPGCGGEYDGLGHHWYHNPDHRPEFTDRQRDILTGLMMGDGTLVRQAKTPHLETASVVPEYLVYLDEIFECIGTGVRFMMSAGGNAERDRKNGFNPVAREENYSDVYRWRTRSHPTLRDFNWYSSGKKVWPDDIELTPTVLKHWYCGDGSLMGKGETNTIYIAMANEMENKKKVESYFTDVGLPTPSNYSGGQARFTKDDSYELWDYMSNPPLGFAYKWPEEYR